MPRQILPVPLALFAFVSCGLATAAGAEPLYTASLATPATKHVIVRDTAWNCTGATCAAIRTATSPDAVVCAAVAKKLGPLTAFAAGDTNFDAAQIDKCNGTTNTAAR